MAIKRIPELQAGQPPTPMEADYFNPIVRAVNALTHLKTTGLQFTISESLATLSVDEAAIAAAAAALPFTVQGGPDTVTVIPGRINGVLVEPPEIATPGDGFIYLEATIEWDFDAGKLGEVTGASIKFAGTVPASTLTAARLPLAYVSADGIDQLETGNKRLLIWQGEYAFV